MDSYDSESRRIFQHFSRSTSCTILCTFGVEVEKTMENHLVDPTEKAENAESSENVTDKRNHSLHRSELKIPAKITNFS